MAKRIDLPEWAFDVAWKISELRYSNFKNRFRNTKLVKFHEKEEYSEHIESILGYLGDIGCAIFLNLDPKEVIKQMLIDTDCLRHRDTHDLVYNSCNLDIKIEDYGSEKIHKKIIEGTITKEEPYGCRLINRKQWEENGENIDYYIFGTTDLPLSEEHKLHQVKSLYFIGFLSKKDLEEYPFSQYTPANKKLHTEAKIIPNNKLKNIELLKQIPSCDRHTSTYENDKLKDDKCQEILLQLEKIFSKFRI